MSRERRNLYRLLHVQPEAPPEVIKAAWRALMSTLRAHPDLGGDTDRAAQLNAAYEVLSDPERRRAYDASLRRPSRGAAAQAAQPATAPPAAAPGCLFCGQTLPALLGRDSQCVRCGSPLAPAPANEAAGAELLGRRRSPRFARDIDVDLHQPGERQGRRVRLRDLSFSGLSLSLPAPLPEGAVLRVNAPQFEALVRVVACRAQAAGHSVHARLLTLRLLREGRGVYVDAQA